MTEDLQKLQKEQIEDIEGITTRLGSLSLEPDSIPSGGRGSLLASPCSYSICPKVDPFSISRDPVGMSIYKWTGF